MDINLLFELRLIDIKKFLYIKTPPLLGNYLYNNKYSVFIHIESPEYYIKSLLLDNNIEPNNYKEYYLLCRDVNYLKNNYLYPRDYNDNLKIDGEKILGLILKSTIDDNNNNNNNNNTFSKLSFTKIGLKQMIYYYSIDNKIKYKNIIESIKEKEDLLFFSLNTIGHIEIGLRKFKSINTGRFKIIQLDVI